jgi:3-isopropylmalate dehydrogenase
MEKKIFRIAVFPGDGIGPEVMREALTCLAMISETSGITFQAEEGLIGGAAVDACGTPLPESSMALARSTDAVLLGAVGGPKWEALPYDLRPERALLSLRESLGLFANLRPVVAYPDLIDASPLKADIVQNIDIMIVRELTGDAYFGKPRGIRIDEGQRVGVNTIIYTEEEIRRIAKVAFDLAMTRRRKVCSVDKANVLESSQLWREVVAELGRKYPEVSLSHVYVDNCAMQLIRNPAQFDVIVTTNMFGDILSDEASVLTGSIGMLPSASLGKRAALYEPIHGSAPDIAGQDVANPLGMILSVAMMLRTSFKMMAEAQLLDGAVQDVLKQGLRTRDIYQEGRSVVGTIEMGECVMRKLRSLLRNS